MCDFCNIIFAFLYENSWVFVSRMFEQILILTELNIQWVFVFWIFGLNKFMHSIYLFLACRQVLIVPWFNVWFVSRKTISAWFITYTNSLSPLNRSNFCGGGGELIYWGAEKYHNKMKWFEVHALVLKIFCECSSKDMNGKQ